MIRRYKVKEGAEIEINDDGAWLCIGIHSIYLMSELNVAAGKIEYALGDPIPEPVDFHVALFDMVENRATYKNDGGIEYRVRHGQFQYNDQDRWSLSDTLVRFHTSKKWHKVNPDD